MFAATIGKVHLDASGEARIALKSQEGDPSGRYLVSLGKGVEAEFALSPASNSKVARDYGWPPRGHLSHCNERKENLPPRTVAAVECRPDADLVESVGFFLFAKKADMLDVYTTRLAANGVEGDGGDCLSGEPGDKPWTSSGADRAGCFLNSQGNANTRFTISKGPLLHRCPGQRRRHRLPHGVVDGRVERHGSLEPAVSGRATWTADRRSTSRTAGDADERTSQLSALRDREGLGERSRLHSIVCRGPGMGRGRRNLGEPRMNRVTRHPPTPDRLSCPHRALLDRYSIWFLHRVRSADRDL